jgi:RNA methyltransferase, TrmH family
MPVQLTSPANPRIKLIRKLRDRKERMQTGLFYIEGLRIVAEALRTGASLEYLVVAPDLLTSNFGRGLLGDPLLANVPVYEVNANTFSSFSLKEGPQGLGAVVQQRWASLGTVGNTKDQNWIALDSVADPGNLGTILRTSDSAGWAGAILLDHAVDPFDPTSVRASMGAIFSQQLVKANLDDFTQWKCSAQIPIVGATGSANDDYHRVQYPQPCILLMGSERQGLSDRHLALCDTIVRIPMVGRSDSLNLSVATALVIYEIFNQRRDKEHHEISEDHPA